MARYKCSSIFILLVVSPFVALAQFNNLGLETPWNEGSIVLKDNSTLTGFMQHNDKLALVKFKRARGDEEQSFSDNSVLQMDYFDGVSGRQRKFASLEVSDESGWNGEVLFEIIMEFKTFAVLSKRYPVNVAIRNRSSQYQIAYAKVGYEQFEKICVIDRHGKLKVILVVNDFEKDKSSPFAGKIQPAVNKKSLEESMGTRWPQVKSYIKDNNLDLKKREDLIAVFKYYGTLEVE